MGPSGSGKTSLLNALSGRIPYQGEVIVNGAEGKISDHKRYIAYITQDDLILSNLTVKENLSFTAQLRLPDSEQGRVPEVIEALGLEGCTDACVGGSQINFMGRQVRGVSGGERRRTIIANALLTNPSLLLLDEPTSGLDSESADSLLNTINDLTKQGRTVVMTLHQPSSAMFKKFDQLMLLSGGNVVYYGPANEAIGYFAKLGHPCEQYCNPAEFLLTLISGPEKIAAYKFRDQTESREWPLLEEEPKFNRTWLEQVKILLHRQWILTLNTLDILPFIQIFVIGILIGLLWFHLSFTDANVRVKNATLTLGMLFGVGFTPVFLSLTGFPVEKMILVRERAAGSYHLSAYYIAKRLAELPFETISPFLYTIAVYWLVFFRPDAHFLIHLLVMIITNYTSSAFGLCFSAIFVNIRLAIVVMTIIILCLVMTSGFYVAIDQLPVWLRWISWISYFRYAYDALIYNEYQGRTLALIPDANFFNNATLTMATGNTIDADLVFGVLGMTTNLWISIVALLGFCLLFNVGAYLLIFFFVV